MEKITTDIVLIDSGVEMGHPALKNYKVDGISIAKCGNKYILDSDINDTYGHGTAIYYMLKKDNPDINIYVIKLFQEDLTVELEDIIFILNFIKQNINCKIIHMSLGVSFCEDIYLFENICDEFYQNKVFIISAFDNLGTLSYPAAFKTVIGVDMVSKGISNKGYQYVINSPVNIRFLAHKQLLPFLDKKFENLIGSSFFAPHISNLVCKNYKEIVNEDYDIHQFLKNKATTIINIENYSEESKKSFPIKKAVVFPFNKEIHSIVANTDLCSFDILGIFDTKYLGNVNKKISEVLPYCSNDNIIQNIEKLDWSLPFDTFILGHILEINNLIRKDYISSIIEKCIKFNKKLYAFDDISAYLTDNVIKTNLNYYHPEVKMGDVKNNTFGKMRCINKPVVAIMGTSPKQGKYTLQLQLRRQLKKEGYRVGQFGTEPTGYLFGFEVVYPFGYNSSVKVTGNDSIYAINRMLGEIERTNPDIIIVGSQSQTVHYNTGNLAFYSIQNTELLLGTEPDGVILVVNYNDPIEYIKRTINYIQSLQETTVIALVVYPISKDTKWTVLGSLTNKCNYKELVAFQEKVIKETDKKCFIVDSQIDIEAITEEIINFFSEDS
ncbi:DUF1611 domain-containing protein [Lactococcus lactis]|uniref:DUF1611 domain-containing protein n=1 Tax=Lactococcus lactis TaxID=1358 RepID=UPI0032E3EED6